MHLSFDMPVRKERISSSCGEITLFILPRYMIYKGYWLSPTTFSITPQPGNNVLAQNCIQLDQMEFMV
jgi:hypothetical protein